MDKRAFLPRYSTSRTSTESICRDALSLDASTQGEWVAVDLAPLTQRALAFRADAKGNRVVERIRAKGSFVSKA
jgi:hypothetical protein